MAKLNYVKHERLWLKGNPDYDEKWLQLRIMEDLSILGIPGDLTVRSRERRQEGAGRLDLLLSDEDAERRYEVELMLGTTDESHIIRCIEYWDIERRRYPAYEHIAVLVAEDVTGRFLNILSLLAGTVPLIVLQCQALKVDDKLLLDFVMVLDQTSLRRDDESDTAVEANRDYWVKRVGGDVLQLVDRALEIINQQGKRQFNLNYNQGYIGLLDDGHARNFVHFIPKRKKLHIKASVSDIAVMQQKLEASDGLDVWQERGRIGITVTKDTMTQSEAGIVEMIAGALQHYDR